jgi:glycosyltransferase involved in cell wall biosynthesis
VARPWAWTRANSHYNFTARKIGVSLRILVMAHAYPPAHNAGAEVTLQALCEHLVSRGHSVDVQLNHPTPTGDYTRNGVRVHSAKGNADPLVHINAGVDVILCHLENTTRAAILGDLNSIPTVHLLHNTDAFNKHCIRRGRCDLAIYNTEWMQKDYEQWFTSMGMRTPASVMMHPAVFADEYKANTKAPHDKITLINLWDGKGGDVFWDIADRMRDKLFLGVKGAYGEQVIEDLHNVEIVSHQKPESMDYIYSRTKILLMPSVYESYGRTAVEAACAGVPTIASPTPGLREALGNDGTFVTNRADPDEWVAAIKNMLKPANYTKAKAGARAIANRQNPRADLDYVCAAIEEAASGYFFALAGRA